MPRIERAAVIRGGTDASIDAVAGGTEDPNFLTPTDATMQGTRIAFDEPTYARLRSVKARYDPRNTFRFNHNIPPDAAAAI